jgi:hypothetical protein
MKGSGLTNKIFLVSVFLAETLLISNGLAIIGETPEQSEFRYRAPIENRNDSKVYKKAFFKISVHFTDGLADRITYKKETTDKKGKPEDISFEEIAILLDNNSNGMEWQDLRKKSAADEEQKMNWKCKNLPLEASYNDQTKVLTISVTDLSKLKSLYKKRRLPNENILNTIGI